MARKCQVTEKKPVKGRSYTRRGIAKKKKGIGLNITGITKRRFLPNLFKKKIWFDEENRFITLKLSTSALRTMNKVGVAEVVRLMRKKGQKV